MDEYSVRHEERRSEMTEEELKERIAQTYGEHRWPKHLQDDSFFRSENNLFADLIMTLIKEARYKSQSDVFEIIADTQQKAMEQLKEAGWKSPEDIQTLIDMIKLGMEAQ